MSDVVLERAEARGGQLACACDVALDGQPSQEARASDSGDVLPLAIANGFTVLAQTLTLTVLPVAGATLAPGSLSAALPFAALLAGAGLATIPAAYLTTGTDRRLGFGLGASLGIAGASIACWGMALAHLPALVLGAFWMGIAHGLGSFYRHGAAARTAGRASAIGVVIGTGAGAALLAPGVVEIGRVLAGPFLPGALILCAGLAHLGVLAADMALAPTRSFVGRQQHSSGAQTLVSTGFIAATSAAGLAWFVMAALMGGAPLRMVECGIDLEGATGLVSWHVLAMYAPAIFAGWLIAPRTRVAAIMAGLSFACTGLTVSLLATGAAALGLAYALAGLGLSVTMVGCTSLLHGGTPCSRRALALHDATLLACAIGGAGFSVLMR